MKGQGLLERRPGWYTLGIIANLLALAAVVTGTALLGDSWWVLLLAPLLAVLSARTAFFGHDAGHQQITGDRHRSRVIQLVHANLLLGMSAYWWNDKHNRHYAHPNHTEKDPDVAADILVFTQRQARGRAGPLTDWFLGGLNYQIEHHLFPSMPRPHLRLVQPLVRAHCRSLGISYTEAGLVDSYRQALRHLHVVGESLRSGEPAAVAGR